MTPKTAMVLPSINLERENTRVRGGYLHGSHGSHGRSRPSGNRPRAAIIPSKNLRAHINDGKPLPPATFAPARGAIAERMRYPLSYRIALTMRKNIKLCSVMLHS
jgi:hypothetical protein